MACGTFTGGEGTERDHYSWVPAPPRLLVFSRAEFTPDARRVAASRRDVELVDLERLYRSD